MKDTAHYKYLIKCLKQLNIEYNEQNINDMQQLQSILMQKLCYPSTQLANLHMQANRLGKLDLRQKQISHNKDKDKDKGKNKDKKDGKDMNMKQLIIQKKDSQQNIKSNTIQQSNTQINKQPTTTITTKHNQNIRYCNCCTLPKQPQTLHICTSVTNVRSVGISTRLFFIAYQHSTIMMFLLFFVYCLYAIISNVKSCNYDANNLLQAYQLLPRYLKLVNQWTFQVSLLANISCMTSSTAYQIQCWLGVLFVILLIIVVTILKYRKLQACIILGKVNKSVQQLSIMIQNLPVNITKIQLQKQFRQYQHSLPLQTIEDKTQINIVKINRAAPLYLSTYLFSYPQIKKINKKYKQIKQQIINLIKSRNNNGKFTTSAKQRQQLYNKFEDIKKQRIQIYKKVIIDKIKSKKQEDANKIITTPSFVTFQSSYNRQFILKYNGNILSNSNNFYFQIPNTDIKIKADISKAPKPQQIIWTNLGQQTYAILKKKILIIIITLIFLCGTCAGLYFLQKSNFEFALANIGKTSTLYLSLVVSIVIVVIAYIVSAILVVLVKRQRNITYMHEQQSLNNKIILSQVGNFLLVPVIFNLFFQTRFTGVVSLSQTVFFLSLQNAYVFPLLKLLDVMYLANRLRKYFASKPYNKIKLTQPQLNQKFQYQIFNVGFQFGYSVRLILFTCFFAPLQPVIVVFSVSGIILMYWIQKYCLYYRCTRPIPGNRSVNISINKFLVLGPILFGIGCLIWPYYIKQQIIALAPCIVMIVLSVIHLLIPFQIIIDRLLEKINKKQREQKKLSEEILYSKQKYNYKTQYDRLNYMTSYQAIHQYLHELHEHNNNINNIQQQKDLIASVNYNNSVLSMIKGKGFYQLFNDNTTNLKNVQKLKNKVKQLKSLNFIRVQSLKQQQLRLTNTNNNSNNNNRNNNNNIMNIPQLKRNVSQPLQLLSKQQQPKLQPKMQPKISSLQSQHMQNKLNKQNSKDKQNNKQNNKQKQKQKQKQQQYENMTQQQHITYSHNYNDNQILIQQILQTIRQYFFNTHTQAHGDSSVNLIRHHSHHDVEFDNDMNKDISKNRNNVKSINDNRLDRGRG